jgi:hypothetical protein
MTAQTDNPQSERITPADRAQSQHTSEQPDPVQEKFNETLIWVMFADISQNLQVSSASIKAAISSLLDTSIIWDRSTQYEFMQSIDKSVDRVASLMAVMTLAMKTVSGQLEPVREPSNVLEILSRVADGLTKEGASVSITLAPPGPVKWVLVDYDYLRIALTLLLQVLITTSQKAPDAIQIKVEETESHVRITITGDFSGPATSLIAWLQASKPPLLPPSGGINSEIMLKVFTATQLLRLQDIEIDRPDDSPAPTSLRLGVPTRGERWMSATSS